ncbi:MAG TPA: class I adenylate-forming enzyme family protein [Longimicrobiaceae bacterium]|nr:class I adenylate-forming enzyme family protein [Longimicrobiaceae bacterium]
MQDEVRTLADVLPAAASRHPRHTALVYGSERISYAGLCERARRVAAALRSHGVEEADAVGIRLPRSPEYVAAYFGAAMAGAVIVPLNPELTPRELCDDLDYCDVRLLVTDGADPELLRELESRCPSLHTVLLVPGAGEGSPPPGASRLRMYPLGPAGGEEGEVSPPAVDPGRLALLLHTSGTTSAPKRVMLSHRGLLANARSHSASLRLRPEDRALVALPLFFGYCNTAQMLSHLLLGGTLVLLPGPFTPGKLCRLVESERVTTFTAVPTLLFYLLRYERLAEHDLSSLRFVSFGGSVMPPERLEELARVLPGVGFAQTYGLTEASPRITTLPPEEAHARSGSVGRPIPGVEVRIVDEAGYPREAFRTGEVVVRGPSLMLGYYRRPEATAQVLRDGWLHTGDLGYLDGEGYLYLVGRKKNVIIRGGVNVYPEEIEEYLLRHPGVAEVLVERDPHPIQGEVPVARIVLREGASLRDAELAAFCRRGLTALKVPTRFELVSALPRTYNQKLRRLT